MKYLIIDWLDGRHLQYEDKDIAEKEYEKITSNLDEEIDVQLFELKKEFKNID